METVTLLSIVLGLLLVAFFLLKDNNEINPDVIQVGEKKVSKTLPSEKIISPPTQPTIQPASPTPATVPTEITAEVESPPTPPTEAPTPPTEVPTPHHEAPTPVHETPVPIEQPFSPSPLNEEAEMESILKSLHNLSIEPTAEQTPSLATINGVPLILADSAEVPKKKKKNRRKKIYPKGFEINNVTNYQTNPERWLHYTERVGFRKMLKKKMRSADKYDRGTQGGSDVKVGNTTANIEVVAESKTGMKKTKPKKK